MRVGYDDFNSKYSCTELISRMEFNECQNKNVLINVSKIHTHTHIHIAMDKRIWDMNMNQRYRVDSSIFFAFSFSCDVMNFIQAHR